MRNQGSYQTNQECGISHDMEPPSVRVEEWSGPRIYYDRYVETHIYDMSLNEIPARQGGNKNVVVWDLKPGKYTLLYVEHPSLISPSFDYTIICLNAKVISADANRIEKHFWHVYHSPRNVDRELRENIIFTLMRQLQSLC